MALDHTRDYFHNGRFDPTDLSQASVALFLTRLITHICAPTFMFLAGTSAYLSAVGRASRAEQSRHLLVRGLWLVALEWTLVQWGWRFQFDFRHFGAMVIWALGWSMVALAAFVWLPLRVTALIGGAMVIGHNLLDGIRPEAAPVPAWLWHVLHVRGWVPFGEDAGMFVLYPLVPWIGVMALGYVFGALLSRPVEERRRLFHTLGWGALALFVILRLVNQYGDPQPWSAPEGRPWYFAALAFVNTEKYPPSLLYLLMTLGTMFLLLAVGEVWKARGRFAAGFRQALMVFGRVPLFYYVLHLPLIHGLALLDTLRRYGTLRPPGENGWPDAGYDLPVVYAVWISVVLLLYPLCVRYDAYKRAHPGGWRRYL
jgi:uncharacterized membrane protein